MAGVIFRHDSSRRHDTGVHPERIARIDAIEQDLSARDWLGYDVVSSPAVADDVLTAVHPTAHVNAIRAACAAGGGMLDADTIVSADSFDAATHAAGGAVALVDALVHGAVGVGAALHRPPGHHAEAARAMGFCLFNSIAVAAQHALDTYQLERVLILDWDVHHGNGTHDIFYADPRVLFISIHESPLYPGTGSAAERGHGAGAGFTVNLPVPAGTGDAGYASLVEHVVAPLVLGYQPQLLLISAGFDAHVDDPLAGCCVTEAGFAAMARTVRDLSAALEAPLGIVLEGGYDLGALTRSLAVTLEVVAGDPRASAEPAAQMHPLALAARERLALV